MSGVRKDMLVAVLNYRVKSYRDESTRLMTEDGSMKATDESNELYRVANELERVVNELKEGMYE